MFQSALDLFPAESRALIMALTAPLRWIPAWSSDIFTIIFGQPPLIAIPLAVFIMLPALLLIAAMWSTMVSLYTLPFRSGRGAFVTQMLIAWWDAARIV